MAQDPTQRQADRQRATRAWRNALLVIVALALAWDLFKLSQAPSRESRLDAAFHAAFLVTIAGAAWAERAPEGSPARRARYAVPIAGMLASFGLLGWRLLG